MKLRNSKPAAPLASSSLPSRVVSSLLFNARLLVAGVLLLGPISLASVNTTSQAQQRAGSTVAFVTVLQWQRQRGVSKYRLQIARDETFKDVFYDGLIAGERYTVSTLLPGYYYWRVAPANVEAAEFLRPVRFFVSGGVIIPVPLNRRAGVTALPLPLS